MILGTIFLLFFYSSLMTIGIELNWNNPIVGILFFVGIFHIVARLTYRSYQIDQITLANYAYRLKLEEQKKHKPEKKYIFVDPEQTKALRKLYQIEQNGEESESQEEDEDQLTEEMDSESEEFTPI